MTVSVTDSADGTFLNSGQYTVWLSGDSAYTSVTLLTTG